MGMFCTRYIKREICYIDWRIGYIARRIDYSVRRIDYSRCLDRIFGQSFFRGGWSGSGLLCQVSLEAWRTLSVRVPSLRGQDV